MTVKYFGDFCITAVFLTYFLLVGKKGGIVFMFDFSWIMYTEPSVRWDIK